MVTTTLPFNMTSVGATADVKTTLNAGNDVIVPDPVKEIQSFTPVMTPTAAQVLDQPLIGQIQFESNDLNLQPIDLTLPFCGGLDAVGSNNMHPILQSWDLNVPTNGGENITVSGQEKIVQTNGAGIGFQLTVSTGRTGRREKFWFNSGTLNADTAAGSNTGATYRINNSKMITDVYGWASGLTPAASVHVDGIFNLQSPDFDTALPVGGVIYPLVGGLATDGAYQVAMTNHLKVAIPTRNNVAITEIMNFADAPSVTAEWMTGVGFYR